MPKADPAKPSTEAAATANEKVHQFKDHHQGHQTTVKNKCILNKVIDCACDAAIFFCKLDILKLQSKIRQQLLTWHSGRQEFLAHHFDLLLSHEICRSQCDESTRVAGHPRHHYI